jgi:hypothetical protein
MLLLAFLKPSEKRGSVAGFFRLPLQVFVIDEVFVAFAMIDAFGVVVLDTVTVLSRSDPFVVEIDAPL